MVILDHEALSQWLCECYALCKDATEDYLKAFAEIARVDGGSANPKGRRASAVGRFAVGFEVKLGAFLGVGPFLLIASHTHCPVLPE